MANKLYEEAHIQNIANAIREKTGKEDSMTVEQMVDEIDGITTEPVLQEKTITENGTVTPDSGYDGMSSVTVNVQPTLQDKSITENGTYTADSGYDGLGTVTVNVEGGSNVVRNMRYDGDYFINVNTPVFSCFYTVSQ